MSLEQKINYQLNKYPGLKRYIKRGYQLAMYAISPKIKSEGDIVRVSPNDGKEYFFGYYDKSPWDATGRYMLCMCANDTWTEPDPKSSIEIILLDTETPGSYRKLATPLTWNVQQGCMAQWLGPDYKSRIIYNDLREGNGRTGTHIFLLVLGILSINLFYLLGGIFGVVAANDDNSEVN